MQNKVYSMLGLAAKAGKLSSGDETCEKLIKSEKAKLTIVADDASANTKKKFGDICSYRRIDIRHYGSKELLGKYTGKQIRAVMVILDKNFARRILELIDGDGERESNGGEVFGES